MPRRGFRSSAARGSKAKPVKPAKPMRPGVGGARSGAGRKPGPQPGRVPWREIRRAAAAGAPYEEIVAGIRIAPEDLQDPKTHAELKAEIERLNALFKLRLRRAIKQRGIEKGSVNSLALMARNELDWDQQVGTGAPGAPDLAGVGARLAEMIEKLSKKAAKAAAGGS